MNQLCPEYDTRKTMTLTGSGQVTADPDTAVIRLGVETTGEALAEIQNQNAQITQNIIETLKNMGITNLKTYQYNINKAYDYQDGNRIDRGYSVRNLLEVRTDQLDQIGNIIDAAVDNGANVVEEVSFELSEPELYYQQALNLAVMDAFQKAKSIAVNLGLPLDPVPIKIIENTAVPIPYPRFSTPAEGAFTTPIESGIIQISASVTVIFQY